MRDKRFIAKHRGGPLGKEQHYQLMEWAFECSEHVLDLIEGKIDERLKNAIKIGKDWLDGKATVGDARKASINAHLVARESTNPVEIAVARSIGQAVATAHMADHCLGAAWYALKAVKIVGESVDLEIKWQNNKLPIEIKDLVLSARKIKGI